MVKDIITEKNYSSSLKSTSLKTPALDGIGRPSVERRVLLLVT